MNNIVLISDSKQYRYSITNSSLILRQCKQTENLIINLIFFSLKIEEKENINKTISKLGIEKNIKTYFLNDDEDFKFKSKINHISKATYIRLFLPSILKGVENVLYLDNDTVVIGDINDAFVFFDKNKNYGRYWNQNNLWVKKIKKKSLMPNENKYVNAGVIHLNLEWMRKNDLEKRFKTFYIENNKKIKYADQDMLNIFIKFCEMPWKFNIARDSWPKNNIEFSGNLNIFHFLSKNKQWDKGRKKIGSGSLRKSEMRKMRVAKNFWNSENDAIWK